MPLLLALVVAAGTAAQPALPPVDPAALAAANTLVQQLNVKADVVAGLRQQTAAMRAGLTLRNMFAGQPGFVAEYRANQAKFDAAFKKAGAIQAEAAEKVIADNAAAIGPVAAEAYARNFTAAELKSLGDFYRTPLGLALYQKGPRVNAEILGLTGRAMGPKMASAMAASAPRMNAILAPLSKPAAAAVPAKK